MNKTYIDSNTILLFIKRVNATPAEVAFKSVACIDNVAFNNTTGFNAVVNKCTAGHEDGMPGDGAFQVTLSGQAITDPTVDEVAYQTLAEVSASREKFEFKMANAAGTYYRAGIGMFTSYDENAGTNEVVGFSGTIKGFGKPVMTKPVEG